MNIHESRKLSFVSWLTDQAFHVLGIRLCEARKFFLENMLVNVLRVFVGYGKSK